MNKLGYKVTIIEVAPGIKKGGTPVNIIGHTIDVVKRMGLFEQIEANQLVMQKMEFKNADDVTEMATLLQERNQDEPEYEIERDTLLDILYNTIKDDVEFVFGNSITQLNETNDHVAVSFKKGQPQHYDLVFGCDGVHSTVRKLCFGEENAFVHPLGVYFSISIIHKLLIPEFTNQMYSEPGKTVMLNAYNGKTDIALAFSSEQAIDYNYRDEAQQRGIITYAFKDAGWRTAELLKEVQQSDTFYFDKLCHVRMPSWTKGRVALVGDAAYCPSPAAGRGGSIAIDGAGALADAFFKHPDNFELAFQEYNQSFRPFIEQVQADVVMYNLDVLVPKTEEAIRQRNAQSFSF
ncbi:FAD-dependent monooxygenase [Mucilaginibacter koreensis]